jgi:hypothetical protein
VTDPNGSLTGAIILELVYGYKVEPSGPDPLIDLADHSAEKIFLAAQNGTWIVDSIPICGYFFNSVLKLYQQVSIYTYMIM